MNLKYLKMPSIKTKNSEIINNLEWVISSKKDKKTKSATKVKEILRKYRKYAIEAIFNGYPMLMKEGVKIKLMKEPVRALTKDEKKRYFISEKHLDYMFTLVLTGFSNYDDFIFYPDKNIIELIKEAINSDKIYEFIKS